jgi:cytochrome P450
MTQVPPGSLGAPFVGEALKFLKDPFTFTLERTKKHGPVWKTKILKDTTVFFAGPKAFSFFMDEANFTRENGSPKFLQEILDPDAVPFLDGAKHKTRKRLLLSAFTKDALASYLPAIFTSIERFVPAWTRPVGPVGKELGQLAFDIADFLFGASDPKTSNVEMAVAFDKMIKGSFSAPIKLPWTAYGKALKARDKFRVYIKNQIANADPAGTALGLLKAARGPGGEQLTPLELEIEMVHFYFAAHGGLTAAFAWALVVLGEHPEIAAKLRAEADQVLGDGTPTHDQIGKLTLARAVWREILRSYPIAPVTFIGVAKQDLEIDGLHIRKGWKGTGAIWATLQDGSTFRDPTVFRDDRLGDDAVAALPHNAFVPQGGGTPDGHRCAGEALTSLIIPGFLAWFTKRYDLVFPAQNTAPGGGGLGPLPRDGLRLAIKGRA